MDVEDFDVWLRILRDGVIVILATFILIYETVFAKAPNVELIGAALALFGLPPVLRLDLRSNGKRRQKPESDYEERWSHME